MPQPIEYLEPGVILPYRIKKHIRYFVFCSKETIKGEVWVRGYDTRNHCHVSRNFKETQSIYV